MSVNYAISMTGIRNAENDLERAARRIASSGLPSSDAARDPERNSDIVSDLVEVKRAAITEKANLRALSMQNELEEDTLDVLA